MILLDGKKVSAEIRAELQAEAAALTLRHGRSPGLAVILVGEDPASQVYVRNKEKGCAEAGIVSTAYRLDASTSQAELEALIDKLNGDDTVDGILLQLPLPKGLDSQSLLERISPKKDVDGFHPESVGRLALNLPGFRSCTPAGVMELLRRYDLSPACAKAVVLGRSNIVGKPLAMMLGQAGPCANATVTLCHSRTKDVAEEARQADFLFAAVGIPKFVKADMVKEGAVVVDVGMHRTDQGLVGDCDFDALKDKVAAMTPVPGGVGPMTIAMLLKNTLDAYRMHLGIES